MIRDLHVSPGRACMTQARQDFPGRANMIWDLQVSTWTADMTRPLQVSPGRAHMIWDLQVSQGRACMFLDIQVSPGKACMTRPLQVSPSTQVPVIWKARNTKIIITRGKHVTYMPLSGKEDNLTSLARESLHDSSYSGFSRVIWHD